MTNFLYWSYKNVVVAIGRILFSFLLVSMLKAPVCQAWLTASDGYNIFITLTSILIGLLFVAILFCFLYHCWIRDLLFDYRSDHRDYQDQRYGGGKGGHGAIPYNIGSGHYKKKPPPPPDAGYYRRSESPSHGQQDLGPRSSPTRLEPRDDLYRSGVDDRYRPSGGPIYHTDVEDPNLVIADSRYDRTTTIPVRATGSPTFGISRQIMSPSALGHHPQNEFDSSLESRRSPSPSRRHLQYTTTTTTVGGPARPPPDYDPSLARSVPFSSSRPGSGLSGRGVETTVVNYRADGAGGPLRDSGTGASLNYQATYQQKVTTTQNRNKAAYFGSSV